MITEDIIKVVKQTRKAQNLTLDQLGDKAKLKKQYISRVEKGDTVPSIKSLVNICNALDMEIIIQPKP